MSIVDWSIVIIAVVMLRIFSLSTRRYMKGVADFLSANRSAGRYLLTIASQMGGFGVVSMVAIFEMYYSAGFPAWWWGFMGIPVGIIILLTGWVYYRFRETRALTLAQFFEMRYSRRFRVFAGLVCWATGILNFGIFPAVAARFLIYFCGLPDHFIIPEFVPLVSGLSIPTFPVVMAVDLLLALMFVTMGGQVSVMITECAQGIFCGFAFLVVSISVLVQVKWPQIMAALDTAPANASMIHPFHTSHVKDFNIWFFLIGLFGSFYAYKSWQGDSGFNSAARSPHEQKMGGIIGAWRYIPQSMMVLLLALAGYTVLHHPDFAHQAMHANEVLSRIDGETIQGQMRVPVALSFLLPIGIKGLLATILLFMSFTCHDTYMHAWGSIFVQDVWIPLRRKLISSEEHIRLLRWSITGVAVFSFFFGLLYPQEGKILMFFAITSTIWVAGSGAAIIGGLYWKRGTTAGAYCALILGAIMGTGGLIVPQLYKTHYGQTFPINGQWLYFIAICCSLLVYIVVSLLTCRMEFDLDRMLHRNKYAKADGQQTGMVRENRWLQIVGITKEFSLGDRVLAIALIVWNGAWFTLFVAGTILNLVFDFSTLWWTKLWHFCIMLQLCISVPVTIWFTVGGVIDMKALYHALSSAIRDHTDDGRVVHESTPVEPVQAEHQELSAKSNPEHGLSDVIIDEA